MSNKQITKLVNIFDSLVVMAVAAWLAWATTVRLSRHGRLCAGGTNNVSEEVHPYAISQGSFLIVIIVLMYTIPPTLFIATNCGCLWEHKTAKDFTDTSTAVLQFIKIFSNP